MDIDIFREELNSRFLPIGKLAVSMTANIPGEPMPRYETIRMVEAKADDVEFRIVDLQGQSPRVIVDVKNLLSLDYTLGTATADVMAKAQKGYAALPDVLRIIQRNADYILQAYNIAVAYGRAAALFEQYNSTGMNNPGLLKNAWTALTSEPYTNITSAKLANAIKATAANQRQLTL